jgi:hypothetical protein
MLLIAKKVFFLVGLTLYIISAHSQTVTSTRNGVWSDPAIWSSGIVPTSVNATGVVIEHEVELPSLYVVSVSNLFINNKLTLKTSSQLDILPDALPAPDLSIAGTLVKEEGSILDGTSSANTTFASGSTYIHQQGPLGFIPYATWHSASTFIINGFRDSGYINIAHSDSWKQTFGNVIYDCPQQSIFVVDLNGYLRNITGDFIIKSTNNKTLRLSTTQNPLINIGGSLIVEGPSELWFSTNGATTVVNIKKDFKYASTSAGPSYLTTRGMISINVSGSLEWNSPGPLRMASSSADSLGLRRAVVNLHGNLSVGPGVIIAPPLGSGNGKIVFKGVGIQSVNALASGSSFQGNLDYTVEATSTVDLGTSALSNTTGSLQVFGTLRVGSSEPQGAIQLTNKGNIHISGTRRYEPGSTIAYSGNSPQRIGNGHPFDAGVNLLIDNPTTTTLLQSVLCHDFSLTAGTIAGITNSVTVHGDAQADGSAMLDIETIRFEGGGDQSVGLDGLIVNNVSVNKSGGSVSLNEPLSLRGLLQLESNNTTFTSNGHLTLLSTSDDGSGTARVGPLPIGSGITGDVTIQRYMSAEGRIFRYISSPVKEASVASLMDDFAVTGRFADPTTGSGVNSRAPSFYYYDESMGSLQGGWMPYPVIGLAKENPLEPGRGYCTLLRQWTDAIVWDVKGTLNQGEIALPVAMTTNMAPSNGWNLVGNPYACTIDWDIDGPNGWSKENISPIFCIRDNGIGSWGSVRYWDGDINYADIPEGQIAAAQSFWVKATGPNPRLTAREGIKVINDASFYRAVQPHIPSFVLVLQRDAIKDKAYYKVRSGANPNVDIWDAIKMDNDYFDISTLSDDGFSLAINSRDSLPCGEKYVQLRLRDVKRGTYKIHLETKFDFKTYTYTLIDNYFDSETLLLPGKEIDLEITDDPRSKSADRLALRLKELIPMDSLEVRAPSVVCHSAAIPVTIQSAQVGIYYSVWENERCLTTEEVGIGGDLTIEIHSDSVGAGTRKFDVIARSACHQTRLTSQVIVEKELAQLSIPAVSACQEEGATLTVGSDAGVLNCYWFADESSADTLARGASWKTPPLLKSQTFYVSATLASGCTTMRLPVAVHITNFDPALITLKDSDTLRSNHVSGNQWLLNDMFISTKNKLLADQTGTYVLIVDTLGCISYDTIEFIYSSGGYADLGDINIYPNPVKDYLTFLPFDHSAQLDIMESSGKVCVGFQRLQMRPREGLRIDIKSLSTGMYFAVIRVGQRKRIMKFIKAE